MNRLATLAAIASLMAATPAFAQGRFGDEAKQRVADREEREAIRRAEHPELYEAAAAKPSEIPAPAAEPAAEPAPAAAPPAQ